MRARANWAMVGIAVVALITSIWCSYVGLAAPNAGAAGVGGLCIVASIYLIVYGLRGGQ